MEISQDTKESSTVRVDAEIYICERFSPNKLLKQNVLEGKLLNGQSLTNGHAFNEVAAKEIKSRKMKSFVITAVIDPNSQKKLSLLKAFSNGILDQVRGTYNNPETNSSMSIPEAISRGYVIVEYKDEVNINDCVDSSPNSMDASKSHIDSSSIPAAGKFLNGALPIISLLNLLVLSVVLFVLIALNVIVFEFLRWSYVNCYFFFTYFCCFLS